MQKFKSLQELFADEKRWTKGHSRVNEHGTWVHNDRDACAWCLSGAIFAIYQPPKRERIIEKIQHALGTDKKWTPLSAWNDNPTRTIDDVRRLVKEAGV